MIPTEDIIPIVKNTIAASIKLTPIGDTLVGTAVIIFV